MLCTEYAYSVMEDGRHEDQNDEDDVRPVEQLVVPVPNRAERKRRQDRQKTPALCKTIRVSIHRSGRSENKTHNHAGDESPVTKDRNEDHASEGVPVLRELDEPCDGVSSREDPDDAAGPAMQDGRLRAVTRGCQPRPDVSQSSLRHTLSKW